MSPSTSSGMKAFKTIKTDPEEKVVGVLLEQKRQEEFSVMRPSKLKQEGSILHNIKMREKKSGKVGDEMRYIPKKNKYVGQLAPMVLGGIGGF